IPKTAGEGNVVTLHLRGGKTLSVRARGERAFEPDFIMHKFRQCATAALSPRAVDEIADIAAHLDQQPAIGRLMTLARGGWIVAQPVSFCRGRASSPFLPPEAGAHGHLSPPPQKLGSPPRGDESRTR